MLPLRQHDTVNTFYLHSFLGSCPAPPSVLIATGPESFGVPLTICGPSRQSSSGSGPRSGKRLPISRTLCNQAQALSVAVLVGVVVLGTPSQASLLTFSHRTPRGKRRAPEGAQTLDSLSIPILPLSASSWSFTSAAETPLLAVHQGDRTIRRAAEQEGNRPNGGTGHLPEQAGTGRTTPGLIASSPSIMGLSHC